MKILAIRGKNLASLESFDVALESGPLARTGIFAITGPTGAGKTTLLDAMCVALFDRTPRLSNMAGVPVGSADQDDSQRVRANDVRGLLRRGSGDGFAEVDFLGRDDRSYRARWEVHRARRSANGKLQQAVLSLTDLETGRVNTGKKTETLQAIEDCLGLSFEQFRRSALLAQNDFAAFLRADKDERSELLERMTGTEVYTRVSVAAFRRAADEAKAVELLQEAADASSILSDDEREAMLAQHAALKAQDQSSRASLQQLQAAIRWYADHHKASLAFEEARASQAAAGAQLTTLAPAEETLRLAREARRHSGVVDAAKLHRQEAEQALATRQAALAERTNAELALGQAQAEVAAVTTRIEDARAQHIAQLTSEQQALDAQLAELGAWLGDNDTLRSAGGERDEFVAMPAEALDTLAPSLAQALAEIDRLHSQALGKSADSKLTLETAKLAHRDAREAAQALGLGQLRTDVTALSDSARDLDTLIDWATRAQKARLLADAARTEGAAFEAQIATCLGAAQATDVRLRSLRDVLVEAEQSFDRIRIALDFSEQRTQLVAGDHCPLCGSEEHPFRDDGQVVQTIVSEQRARVETLRAELDALTRHKAQQDAALTTANEGQARSESAARGHDEERGSLTRSFVEHPASCAWRDRDVCDAEMIPLLRHRAGEIAEILVGKRAALASAEAAETKVHERAAIAEALQSLWEIQQEELGKLTAQQQLASERFGACQAQRYRARASQQQACAGKIEVVRTRLAGAGSAVFPALEAMLQTAAQSEQQAGKRLAAAQRGMQVAEARIAETDAAIERCDQALEAVLDELGCSWAEFGKRLSLAEEAMQDIENALLSAREQAAQAQGSLRQCGARIAELETASKPDIAEAEARAESALLDQRIAEQSEALLELGARLKSDGQARANRDALDKRLLEAVTRAHTFRTLSDLIGSADGKKFRVFAQSLTLDTLLHGANQHLLELAPRYLLQRVPGHDLDLQIVDRDLGDDVRSVNSLSGGEGFLISLALALGLSSLASREVRVESLLVDEGFGSLDEDTLEIALGVLDSLQATGRKVGLISHVPGFAERIGAQVRVTPEGGGKSSVQVCAAAP